MLTVRKRGKTFHVRGSVKIGETSRHVREHSTGSADEEIAQAYAAKLRRDIETELLHGRPAIRREVTFDSAALTYLNNHGHLSDETRVRALASQFSGMTLGAIDVDAWQRFCREVLPGRAGATWERHAIALRGIFAAGGVPAPKLPRHGSAREIIAVLDLATADRLIDAYADHVRPIALVARYMGLRAQEALQLKRRDVDMARGEVLVRAPKNGKDRRVPIPPRPMAAIEALADCPPDRNLFLHAAGHAWPDTRHKGGNPMRYWHEQACAAAGVHGFRWHDWRHHWATWCLRAPEMGGAGLDVRTLMQLGGWTDMGMVLRYAAADKDAAAKLARMG